MIKFDIKQYIRDRVWHGYWFFDLGHPSAWEWRRDPSKEYRWKVMLLEDAVEYDQD